MSFFFSLFISLFVSISTYVFIVHFGYTQHYDIYFVAQIVSALVIGHLSGGLLCAADIPHPLFCEHYLPSWHRKLDVPGSPWTSLPWRYPLFSQRLWALLVENGI